MCSGEEKANIQLVREVEKHPLLYNFKLVDYSKRDSVDAAWNEIAEALNDDALNCKEKWRNLRTVFVRKLKPLPPGGFRRKVYYLNDAMSFLIPFIKLQRSNESVNSPVRSESENVTVSEEPLPSEYDDEHGGDNDADGLIQQPESPNEMMYTQYSANVRTSFRQPKIKRAPDFVAEFSNYVESKRSSSDEADESRKYFLLSLLPDVKKLTDNQMKFFRRKMLDALEEAEACAPYNENSTNNEANGVGYFHSYLPKREC